MKHRKAYREGLQAYDGEPCPYPEWMLGQRCAWLAGYHEARNH